jgi:membrane protein YqaA with SNARE-associated domain
VFPQPSPGRATAWLTRYGPPALFLSWVPVVGDGLCVAAGWLRQNVAAVALFMATGKAARYVALVAGWDWLRS